MSSVSPLEVTLSGTARLFLESLERRRQTKLALHLLTLRKSATPEGSRALAPDGKPSPTDRIWLIGDYEILYSVRGRQVAVGVIRFA